VEQLLAHTSGLTGNHGSDHQPLGRDQALAAISRLDRAFAPGSEFLYSNAGYTLLAIIIEEASGMTYRDSIADRVLPLPSGAVAGGFWDGDPPASGPWAVGVLDDGTLGASGEFAGPHWALDGNGGLAMTSADLAAWTHALFTGQVVSPASIERISTPGVDLGDGMSATPGWVELDDTVLGERALAAAGGGSWPAERAASRAVSTIVRAGCRRSGSVRRLLTEHLEMQCPDRVVSAAVDDGVERQLGHRAARRLTTAPMSFLNRRDGVGVLEREGTVG